ncbi:hypothetical protein QO002_000621 [Pararhizobium capsulatum DSM 1112]|uniref:Transmembrane protein n=1 Tax=Pararhizobium capsulatum DSM 1112 TaxID=1121113 RepID=A0ABU0BJS1_9HYPH|nr:hypothetical protein [Pararhizobium capsulatum DSM 1112]
MIIAVIAYFVVALAFMGFSYAEGRVALRPSWTPTRVLGLLLAIVWPGILLVVLITHFVMKFEQPQNTTMIPGRVIGVHSNWR